MIENLILVDEQDKPMGKLEKLLVHQLGLLHRAFSVFIFNKNGDLLLQQRADCKYHSPGLWTNTCCSHPRYGENLPDAVKRRLKEEMGLQCNTYFTFSFIYKAIFENGLTEHEYDHVYFGVTDNKPQPDAAEVKDWKYISLDELEHDIERHPENYTAWLKISLAKVRHHYNKIFLKVNSVDLLQEALIF
jgi:isopentenyl-diphosphate delta-isomerase